MNRLLAPLIGSESSTAERLLVLAAVFGGAACAVLVSDGMPVWARLVLAVVAADMTGGIVANATPSVSGWWRAFGPWAHALFISGHLAHGLAAVLAVNADSWSWAIALQAHVTVAGLLVIWANGRSWRRGLALFLTGTGCATWAAIGPPHPALSWFAPILFVKLVGAYADSMGRAQDS